MREPTLYIMIRSDIPQMNPGKLGAQCAHAASAFAHTEGCGTYHAAAYTTWLDQADNFGTTIVLVGDRQDMDKFINSSTSSGMIMDPTYPMTNWSGETFTESKITVAWAFAYEPQHFGWIAQFELHP